MFVANVPQRWNKFFQFVDSAVARKQTVNKRLSKPAAVIEIHLHVIVSMAPPCRSHDPLKAARRGDLSAEQEDMLGVGVRLAGVPHVVPSFLHPPLEVIFFNGVFCSYVAKI